MRLGRKGPFETDLEDSKVETTRAVSKWLATRLLANRELELELKAEEGLKKTLPGTPLTNKQIICCWVQIL